MTELCQTRPSTFKYQSPQGSQNQERTEHTHGSGCDRPEKGEIFSGLFASVIKLTHSESHAYRQPTARNQPENHE